MASRRDIRRRQRREREGMGKRYDVIIVGAGPAGIFASIELSKRSDLSILLVEKGKDIEERIGKSLSLMSGWGGAGAFSDGKLTLSTEVGGWLSQYLSERELSELIEYVDDIYLDFGAPQETYGLDETAIEGLKRRAILVGLSLIPSKIRHLGTERCRTILKGIRDWLGGRVDILTETKAERVLVEGRCVKGIETADGRRYHGRCVILAPGREGASWLLSEARRLGLSIRPNTVDIGVRVEAPAPLLEPVTSTLYEGKFVYYSKTFEDRVRTFCMCPYGYVSTEVYEDVITVNGHSYRERKGENTNFAILVSTTFTEPFKEPIAFGKYIARLANLLGGGIILQRLGDLREGRRSTYERIGRSIVKPTLPEATPGDLSFVLPFRYLKDILEMLEALDAVLPGINGRDTLLYGVEAKFYSSRVVLNRDLETEIKGLYAIGDGAGITRGLVQASVSGIIAARAILKKTGIST